MVIIINNEGIARFAVPFIFLRTICMQYYTERIKEITYMILNIIYFIGGFLIGIGIAIAYCKHIGKKMLKRMDDLPDYSKKDMMEVINDVVNDNKDKP